MSLLKRIGQNQPTETQSPSRMRELRVRRQPMAPARDTYYDIKGRVQNRLIAELDPKMDVSRTEEVRATIEELFDAILNEESIILSRAERQRLFEQIVA